MSGHLLSQTADNVGPRAGVLNGVRKIVGQTLSICPLYGFCKVVAGGPVGKARHGLAEVDGGDGGRDGDLLGVTAGIEGQIADGGQIVGKRNAFQAGAIA